MVILISGASHTGKTLLAQKILEKYRYPYLSIDHLKMGLIRSGKTELTPYDDDKLTLYLWDILREIIKTAIENDQNLTIEGCYIPFDWAESFDNEYLSHIRYICLIMSDEYIRSRFADIARYANVIENRIDESDLDAELLMRDNRTNFQKCKEYGLEYQLIDNDYDVDYTL